MNIGNVLIKLAAVLTVIAFVGAVRWARGRSGGERLFRLSYHGITGCLLVASAILMHAILTHDFRYEYVIGYSSRDLPLLYLISAFWAGQSGTFLLWALATSLMGYALIRKTSWHPAAVMVAYIPMLGFLNGLMLDPGGNPFKMAAQVPADGRGLNPLLQDPWMASHPPLVFLGYAALAVPAALALAAVFTRRERQWLEPALRWSLAGFVLLGLGIVLGGFWAYKVLGWGGYWGWDPVENASLVPWIAVAALLHGLLVQRATGALRRTNLVLAMATYFLVLYSTFLTRSGVLADFSVHSFPAGTIYKELVLGLVLMAGVSVLAFWWRGREKEPTAVPFELGWPMVLSAAILLLALSGALILVATSWPILSGLTGQASTIAVPFYNKVNLPLYVLVFALLAVAPLLSWSGRLGQGWWRRLLGPAAVALAATAGAAGLGAQGAGYLALFAMAAFALATSTVRFAHLARHRLLNTGAPLAHAGFALMFLGVVASAAWTRTAEVGLPQGQPVEVLGRTLTYQGHVAGSEPEHRWRVAVGHQGAQRLREVTLHRSLEPGQEEAIMRKPGIYREVLQDVYVIPTAVQPGRTPGHVLDLAKGEPVDLHGASLTFVKFDMAAASDDHGMTVRAVVEVDADGKQERVSLPFGMVGGRLAGSPVEVGILPGTALTIQAMAVEQGIVQVLAQEEGEGTPTPPTLMIQASTKPLMQVMWLGTFLLGLGCVVALARRLVDARARAAAHDDRRAGASARRRAA